VVAEHALKAISPSALNAGTHDIADLARLAIGDMAANRPAPEPAPPDGVSLIAAERRRQIMTEGWSEAHDDTHDRGELAQAAACYALQHTPVSGRVLCWPWNRDWWKPKGPIRDLARAGALIAAEIDRLQRAEAPHAD
jgi:hypothetical protein